MYVLNRPCQGFFLGPPLVTAGCQSMELWEGLMFWARRFNHVVKASLLLAAVAICCSFSHLELFKHSVRFLFHFDIASSALLSTRTLCGSFENSWSVNRNNFHYQRYNGTQGHSVQYQTRVTFSTPINLCSPGTLHASRSTVRGLVHRTENITYVVSPATRAYNARQYYAPKIVGLWKLFYTTRNKKRPGTLSNRRGRKLLYL